MTKIAVLTENGVAFALPPTTDETAGVERRGVPVYAHYPNEAGNGGIGVLAWYYYGDSFIHFTTAVCSNSERYVKKTAREILNAQFDMGIMVKWPLLGVNRREATCADVRRTINAITETLFV